jgi:hypothetical protein
MATSADSSRRSMPKEWNSMITGKPYRVMSIPHLPAPKLRSIEYQLARNMRIFSGAFTGKS